MAKERLIIPEENLADVIAVILNGLDQEINISEETRTQLKLWCNEETEYLKEISK